MSLPGDPAALLGGLHLAAERERDDLRGGRGRDQRGGRRQGAGAEPDACSGHLQAKKPGALIQFSAFCVTPKNTFSIDF